MKIILFTGLSASGKSAVANKVAEELDISQINLHSILHEESKKRGFTRIRDWMESEGDFDRILEKSRPSLLEKIASTHNESAVIVDQIIDPSTLIFLKENLPQNSFYTIFVRANRHDRKHWATKRDKENGVKDMRLKDNLKQTSGIREIIEQADLRVENITDIDELSREITSHLRISLLYEGRGRGLERNS